MSTPLSIYTYLFRARAGAFDLDATVANFTSFADEVVITTLADQEDDTLDRLLRHEDALGGRLKVVIHDTDITRNNRFDGDLKTAALNACTHPVRIIADCDERFVLSQRPRWDDLAQQLLSHPRLDGWLIPVIDLYGSREYTRADQPVGLKMRMHKDTVRRRGVPAFAERGQGLFDTSKSDSTEPLLANGGLASFFPCYDRTLLQPNLVRMLAGECYVIHEGFLDLQRRADLGRTFWKQHWEARSGKTERVATKVEDLQGVQLVKHGLPLS